MIGKRFGKLVVVSQVESRFHKRRWFCKCDCGNTTTTWEKSKNRIVSMSCGCLKREATKARWEAYRGGGEYFWCRVNKGDGCWEWLGTSTNLGYGQVGYKGKLWKSHRLAYFLTNGEIPNGAEVMHKCDNKLCVNPDHLILGSHADNMADMKIKGRRKGINSAEKNGRAKLTMRIARKIREKYSKGNASQVELAGDYGVSQYAISQIVRNKRYIE